MPEEKKSYLSDEEVDVSKSFLSDEEVDITATVKKNSTPNGGVPSQNGTLPTSPSKSTSTLTKYEPIQGIEKAPVKEFKPLAPVKEEVKFDISDSAAPKFEADLQQSVEQLKPDVGDFTTQDVETVLTQVGAPAAPKVEQPTTEKDLYKQELEGISSKAKQLNRDLIIFSERGDQQGAEQAIRDFKVLQANADFAVHKYPEVYKEIQNQEWINKFYEDRPVLETGAAAYNALIDGVKTAVEFPSKMLLSQTEGLGYDTKGGEKNLKIFDDFVENNVKWGESTEKFQKADGTLDWSKFFPALGETVGTMAALIGGANLMGGGNAGLFASSYVLTRDDYYKQAKERGLNLADANAYADAAAGITSVLELVSPNPSLLRGVSKTNMLDDYVKSLSMGKAAAAKNLAKNILTKEVLPENAQEIMQAYADKITESATNMATGQDVFDPEYFDPNELVSTIALTSAATLLLSGGAMVADNASLKKNAEVELAKDLEATQRTVDGMLQNGQIDEVQAQSIMERAAKVNAVVQKIPDTIPQDKVADVAEVLEEKESIEQSIEGKDPALVEPQKVRLEELNTELKNIANESTRPIEPTVEGVTESVTAADTGSKEGVQQENVRVGQESVSEPITTFEAPEIGTNKPVPTPEIPLSEQKRENKQVEEGLNEQKQENKVVEKTLEGNGDIVTPEGFVNRVFESNVQLGEAPADAHISEEGYNYRVLSQNEIDAISESGGVFAREGKQKGGNKNTKYWTKGNNKNWYGDKANTETIRVKQDNFKDNEVVRAENVEVYNKETKRFEPLIKEQSIKATPQSENEKQEIKDETEKEITTSEVAPEVGLQQRLGETGEELTTPAAELNKPEELVVETEAVAEPAKTGELTPEEKENLQGIEKETGVNFRIIQNVYEKHGEGKPLSEITKADFEKAQEKREKANEVKAQKAKAEKTIDEAANWLKDKLKIDLPEGTKKAGFGQDELIDLVANAVKALVNTGIEVNAAVKQVMDSLREGGYLEDFDEVTISKKAQAKAVRETKKEKVEAQKELLGLYETLSGNPTTNAEFGKTLEANPLAYQVIANTETRNEAVEYVKENGFAQALDNVLKGKIPNGRLNTAVSYYLYSAMQTELVKAIEEGNTALADEILQVKLDLVGKVGERLKNAGQEIQAAVFFAQDLSDPIAANFHYERAVQKANEEIKERKKGEAEREVRKAKRVAEQGEKEFEAAVQEKFNTEKPKRSSLSKKEQQRKSELRNKILGKVRDVASVAAELLDPEFYEYGALIIKDGYKDFQSFSKKVIQETGGKLKKVLVNLYKGSAQRAIDDGIMSESEITTDKEISKFLTDKLTDKQIDKLIRENLGTKLAEIAKEYYKQGEELKTPQGLAEKIIEVLKEEIPLTKEDALRMAKWIDGRYSTLVKERVSKALEQQVKARITQEGKSKTEEHATVPFADKLANGLLNGTLTADQFIDYFGAFYGLTTYTAADTKFVTDMVNKIKATDLDFRKNEYTYAVMKHMVDKHPVEILDALNAAWYGAVLSGIGTQDVNITFGLDALQFSFFEQLADTVAETFAAKGNKERIKTAWSTFFTGLAKVMNDGKPDNSDSNVKKVWNAIKGFGSGARNAAAYAYTKGVSSFEDNASQLEFESRKDIDFTKISENLQAGNWLSRTKKNLATFAAKKYFNNLKYFSSRSLAAADLFFNNLIWRQEIAPVMERYYRETTNPDGTKRTEKQIRAEMQKLFFATEEQYEQIQDKAAEERMKFDFEFEQNKDGKWEILDNGKKEKQTFDTKAEAVEYAEDNLARKGLVYQRSVIELLNQRIPKEQMQIAKAMAADAIGTGETKGTAGVVYNMINYLKVLIDRKARDKGKTVQTAAFIVNKMILPAFVKFPLNFVNMTTNYSPLGFLRAYSKNGTILPVGSKFARDMDNEYQRQRMVYRAAYGTVLLAAGLIKYLDFGDDDEETDKKREERYNDYLKMGGDPTINIENPMFNLPKDGDVIGSLAFLPPKKKEFLIQSGLAQEYSQYDAKKNRWISFIADRAAVSKQIAGTVNAYMRFVWSDPTLSSKGELDAKKAASVFGSIVSATIDQYLQLSSLKGTQRLLSAPSYSQGATGKVSDIAVTAATTPLQIFQPALTRQLSQYIDGKMREYPSITKMDEADYGILLAKQNLIPFGSVFFKGDVRYDQFGDPMISVPAEKQGMLSSNYSAAAFDKYPNRKLQLFLYENGVFEYKQPPMTMYYYPEGENVEGRPQYEFLTHKEIKEVGLQAAKYYKEILTKNMGKAQEVANSEWKDKFDINKPTFETKFSKYIDKLYELSLDRAFEEFVASKNGVVSEEKTKQAKRKPQSTSESDKQYRKRIRYKTAEEKYLKEIEE